MNAARAAALEYVNLKRELSEPLARLGKLADRIKDFGVDRIDLESDNGKIRLSIAHETRKHVPQDVIRDELGDRWFLMHAKVTSFKTIRISEESK
ncbi:hypothetical protein EBZ80_07215 [bacterium]|nr:hypothetical protein [bacterium]